MPRRAPSRRARSPRSSAPRSRARRPSTPSQALAPADRVKIIAEVKRASPSRGALADIADPAALGAPLRARRRERDQRAHRGTPVQGGSSPTSRPCAPRSRCPVLRKDFIATPYQVLEARAAGADLVLLIVAALDAATCSRELHALIVELGMTPLVETHSADEVDARRRPRRPRSIGVNARDLSTLRARPRPVRPPGRPHPRRTPSAIAESAVLAPADVAHYRAAGADVVLVGEALVTRRPRRRRSQRVPGGRDMSSCMSLREAPARSSASSAGASCPSRSSPRSTSSAAAYEAAKADPAFQAELAELLPHATPAARRSSPRCRASPSTPGGARIILKREDLNHTGSHKINNVLGQALLTKRIGKTRVIAETGAGQHGVATATAAALFGLECTIYMGEVDTERQALNVARMRLLGAEVVPVTTGSRTLKDAINEAYRDWVTSVETTNYIFGTAAGPHPFPAMVRDFQKIIGEEARAAGARPDRAGCPTRSSPASAAAPTRSASSTPSSTTPT